MVQGIPLELIESFERASGLTLLVGHDLEQPNMVVDVRAELLRRMERTDASLTLPRIAEMYQASRSRFDLLQVARDILSSSKATHELEQLGAVAWDNFLTVSPSNALGSLLVRLERHDIRPVSSLDDAAFANRVSGQPWLVHLFGQVKNPDTVRLTETDVASFAGPSTLVQYMKDILVTTTVMICGFAPEDPYLELVNRVRSAYANRRPAYVIWPDGLKDEGGLWRARGVQTVDASIEEVCRVLPKAPTSGRTIRARPPAEAENVSSPFKFLDYYTEADSGCFFGRDAESHVLATTVEASRLTFLIGPSGCGKTSLVNAGVVPLLHERGFDTYAVRLIEDPQDEVLSAIGLEQGTAMNEGSLLERLKTCLPGSRSVLIIDQFEELFLRVGDAMQVWFSSELAQCIQRDEVDVRFVLILRDEFLHLALGPTLGLGDTSRQYWVRPFLPGTAISVLTQTAEMFGVPLESDLTRQVVDDLKAVTTEVEPAQLQVIAHELYSRSQTPKALTVAGYDDAGRAAGILGSYLGRCVDALPEAKQGLARRILMAMVSPEATKTVVHRDELFGDPLLKLVNPDEGEIDLALQLLMDQRIVRMVPDHPAVYELAHDTMALQIFEWLSPLDLQITYARQLLRQAIVDWEHLGTMPKVEQWSEIDKYVNALRMDEGAVILGLTVGAHYGTPLEPWVQAAERLGLNAGNTLGEILRGSNPKAQYNVLSMAEVFAQSAEWALRLLCEALASEYISVRRHAARILRRSSSDRDVIDLVESAQMEHGFVRVAGGPFPFGTNDEQFEQSGPQVVVHVSSFSVQKHPVTNADYLDYIAEADARPPAYWLEASPPTDRLDHPVVGVSWFDAVGYCRWYGERHGLSTRLPTAAEWEKAATWNQGQQRKYNWSWGDKFECQPPKGNSRDGGPGETTPVGHYSPFGGDAPCGAADMCGNTFDWVSDWSAPTHDRLATTDPTGPENGTHKCARGGSWAGSPTGTSGVSHKYSLTPETRNEYTGFRMVMTTDHSKETKLEELMTKQELGITLNEANIKSVARDMGSLSLADDFAAMMTPINTMENESNLRAYLAAAAICHNTKGGLRGEIDAQQFNGWDFLLRAMIGAAESQGTFPWDSLSRLTGSGLVSLLETGATHAQITLSDMDRRAELLQLLHRDLNDVYGGSVSHLLSETNGFLRGEGGAYERLEQLTGFRDPLRKKSTAFLMAVHFSGRYQFLDSDKALPMIDYHRMRLLLRTGCIGVEDPDTRRSLTTGSSVPTLVEERIRLAAMDVCERIPRLAGMPMFEFDVLLWAHARSCCRHRPMCVSRSTENPSFSLYLRDGAPSTCIFEEWCPGATDETYRNLWEPIIDTEAY